MTISDETTVTDEIDLRADDPAAELARVRAELAETAELLAAAEAEIGQLELQLELFTSTDPLTGLVNRSGLLDTLQAVLDRLDRTGESAALVLVRVPGLAGLGEGATDLIRDLAAILGGGLRRLDRVGRLDRTTFGLVLADTTEPGCQVVVARIRGAIGSSALAAELGEVEVMSSAVVVAERPAPSAEQVFGLAVDDLTENPNSTRVI